MPPRSSRRRPVLGLVAQEQRPAAGPRLASDAPKAPERIALMPAEQEGFAALRQAEVALANRIAQCASAVLKARGVPETAVYDGERDANGVIVGFKLKRE